MEKYKYYGKITYEDKLYFFKWFKKNYKSHQYLNRYKISYIVSDDNYSDFKEHIFYNISSYNELNQEVLCAYNGVNAFNEFVQEEVEGFVGGFMEGYHTEYRYCVPGFLYEHFLYKELKDKWETLYEEYIKETEETIQKKERSMIKAERAGEKKWFNKPLCYSRDIIEEIRRKEKEEGEKPYYIIKGDDNIYYTFLYYFIIWVLCDFYSVKGLRRRKLSKIKYNN